MTIDPEDLSTSSWEVWRGPVKEPWLAQNPLASAFDFPLREYLVQLV